MTKNFYSQNLESKENYPTFPTPPISLYTLTLNYGITGINQLISTQNKCNENDACFIYDFFYNSHCANQVFFYFFKFTNNNK